MYEFLRKHLKKMYVIKITEGISMDNNFSFIYNQQIMIRNLGKFCDTAHDGEYREYEVSIEEVNKNDV